MPETKQAVTKTAPKEVRTHPALHSMCEGMCEGCNIIQCYHACAVPCTCAAGARRIPALMCLCQCQQNYRQQHRDALFKGTSHYL